MRSFQQWAEFLGVKQSRPVGNNTRVRWASASTIAIQLHATDVVTLRPDGSYTLSSGGWRTSTTKSRLNKHSPVRVWSCKGQWTFTSAGKEHIFTDGVTIAADGTVTGAGNPDQADVDKARIKAIKDYASLCAKRVPLDPPDGGDCWYCLLREQESGKPLGETIGDTSHLESHLTEGYVVPSLVVRALRENGTTDFVIAAAFKGSEDKVGSWQDLSRSHVKRAVSKYLLRQFKMG